MEKSTLLSTSVPEQLFLGKVLFMFPAITFEDFSIESSARQVFVDDGNGLGGTFVITKILRVLRRVPHEIITVCIHLYKPPNSTPLYWYNLKLSLWLKTIRNMSLNAKGYYRNYQL